MDYNKRLNELIAEQNNAYFSSEAKDAIDCAIAFKRERDMMRDRLENLTHSVEAQSTHGNESIGLGAQRRLSRNLLSASA
jgi:hypothetical protein